MGWAGGSEMAADIWDLIEPLTNTSNRKKIAKKLIDIFENQDCDTIYECEELCNAAGRKSDE